MRKSELEVKDRSLIDEALQKAEVGYLSFNGPDGWPRITPLNFAYDGRVLWHGATAGERFECLEKDHRATFATVSLQRYIPSHFAHEEMANLASAAFKSVIVRGRCSGIRDPIEKCEILNRLMEKYQPEGRYKPLTPDDPFYRNVLNITGVYALEIEEVTAKFKFAQSKPEEARRKMAARLQEMGGAVDCLVAEEILKTIP
jgi:uncharacterized protein